MPTITWNKDKWDVGYHWPQDGDEWSRQWGGPKSQWITCIWPPHRGIPARTIRT
jgi:hypothetical protein